MKRTGLNPINCRHCGFVFTPSLAQIERGKKKIIRNYAWIHISIGCPRCGYKTDDLKVKYLEYEAIEKAIEDARRVI